MTEPNGQHFFGKQIEVDVEGEVLHPVSFRLDDVEHGIETIMVSWVDYGFGDGPRLKHRWWEHHHRNYYRVKTAAGRVFEIYHDRGVSLASPHFKKWYVTRELPSLTTQAKGSPNEVAADRGEDGGTSEEAH